MLDNAAVIALGSFALLLIAYLTYGRFLARRIFRLDPDRPTPAHTMEDGVDYVPTRIPVLFGHHFASIAGLGPILGPAIAVIWGWVPAVLWVILGSIFIGAVHDLGALHVSLHYKGRSIGDVCQDLIGPRARLLALVIIFFLVALAMGAFVLAVAGLFVNYNPDAIIPSFGLMLVAMVIGVAVYKLKFGLGPATVLGLAAFAGLIFWGVKQPVTSYQWFASAETRSVLSEAKSAESTDGQSQFERPYGATAAANYLTATGNATAAEDVGTAAGNCQNAWIVALLVYAFIASVLPVWLLLQPRDYINSFQLYFALATLLVGLTVAAAIGHEASHIDAAMFRPVVPMQPLEAGQSLEDVEHAPSWFPLLFVIIACGAASGFHSLVSSGTTVRQLNRETDALPIGYGAMLTEGGLAILVIMACTAGLGAAAWQPGGEYESWGSIKGAGLAVQLAAVVRGGANFLGQLGIPAHFGTALLAVTIVAFALTTLDTGTRLLRFNVEELCRSLRLDFLANRYFASLAAAGGIAFFAFILSSGGKTLWTLFGTTNQLLAGLSLLTVSVFLYKLGRPIVYTLVPMFLMLGVSVYALLGQLQGFIAQRNWPLVTVASLIFGIAGWLVIEAVLSFARGRGGLDFDNDGTIDVPAES